MRRDMMARLGQLMDKAVAWKEVAQQLVRRDGQRGLAQRLAEWLARRECLENGADYS